MQPPCARAGCGAPACGLAAAICDIYVAAAAPGPMCMCDVAAVRVGLRGRVRVRVGVSTTGRYWPSVLIPVFMQPPYGRPGSTAPARDVAAAVCDVAAAAPVPPA